MQDQTAPAYEWCVTELQAEVSRLSAKAQAIIARQVNITGTKYLSSIDLEVTQSALRLAHKRLTTWRAPLIQNLTPKQFLKEIGL